MPKGNGTGPPKEGEQGRGRKGGPQAAGPGRLCVCLKCGHRIPHVAGQPCDEEYCAECGAKMKRE
jgi:hypothetical protein